MSVNSELQKRLRGLWGNPAGDTSIRRLRSRSNVDEPQLTSPVTKSFNEERLTNPVRKVFKDPKLSHSVHKPSNEPQLTSSESVDDHHPTSPVKKSFTEINAEKTHEVSNSTPNSALTNGTHYSRSNSQVNFGNIGSGVDDSKSGKGSMVKQLTENLQKLSHTSAEEVNGHYVASKRYKGNPKSSVVQRSSEQATSGQKSSENKQIVSSDPPELLNGGTTLHDRYGVDKKGSYVEYNSKDSLNNTKQRPENKKNPGQNLSGKNNLSRKYSGGSTDAEVGVSGRGRTNSVKELSENLEKLGQAPNTLINGDNTEPRMYGSVHRAEEGKISRGQDNSDSGKPNLVTSSRVIEQWKAVETSERISRNDFQRALLHMDDFLRRIIEKNKGT